MYICLVGRRVVSPPPGSLRADSVHQSSSEVYDDVFLSGSTGLYRRSHLGITMENEAFDAKDGESREKAVKHGEPRAFDDVDLSIATHSRKNKQSDIDYNADDVESAKNLSDTTEVATSPPSHWYIFMISLLFVGFFVALGVGLALGHPDPRLKPYQFSTGAVASDHSLCSEVGRDLLLNGGNAIDAAIGTSFCLGVVNPHVGGIGGGGYLLFYKYNTTGIFAPAYDAQVVAPELSTRDMFNGSENDAQEGGRAIAVPGVVAGLYKAYQEFGGSLPWADLLEPAIRLCRRGFTIGAFLADAISADEAVILREPSLRELFAPNGVILKMGEDIFLPKLGRTLQIIADDSKSFYTGDLAKDILLDIQEAGGNMTVIDLANYSTEYTNAVSLPLGTGDLFNVGGTTVYAPPPPSCGILSSFIIHILEGFNLDVKSVQGTGSSVQTYHRMLEAFKFAFAEKGRLGDPSFVDGMDEVIADLMSTSVARNISTQGIKSNAQTFPNYGSLFASQLDSPGGATHISVVDKDGSAASYTSSLSLNFGAKRRGVRTGVIFNSGMGDFSLPSSGDVNSLAPSPANYIQAKKRPLSSMSPLIITNIRDNEVKAVIGSSGGAEMITASAQMAVQTIWLEENVINAMARRRIHTNLMTDSADMVTYKHEMNLTSEIVDGLASRGQVVDGSAPALTSSVNLIMQSKKNRFYTNSDDRTPGSGYALYEPYV